MRRTLSLALAAAAFATVAAPSIPAHAIACREPLGPVCYKLCKVMIALDRPCLR
jgi:hypothetical protein